MSDVLDQEIGAEQPIVIHGPVTGEVDPLDGVVEIPLPTGDLLDPTANTQSVSEVASATLTPAATPAPGPTPAVTTGRAMGLDAFRGLLLLLMNFAFTIPQWGPFPAWMYHTQEPPSPDGGYLEIAGLTWRDMTYPGFLFTMAAALPVVMGARIAKGMSYPNIIWIAVRRAALLMLFALIIGQVNPYWTKDYTQRGDVVAMVGLLVCFAFFVRPRRDWSPTVVRWLRRGAYVAVAAVLFALPALVYGKGFSITQRDDIIWSIAYCTVAGTVVWLATRFHLKLRLALLAVVIVARQTAPTMDWVGNIFYYSPIDWLYEPWFLELLIIVIPGTIAGDLLSQWMRRSSDAGSPERWSNARLAAIMGALVATVPVLLVGLYHRQNPAFAGAGVTALAGVALLLTRDPRSDRDQVLTQLCRWAALWLVVGMLLEPFEGGIKKDPQTLSYLILMTGVAYAGFTSMLIVVDAFNAGKRHLRALVEIGQNPLFAYVVYFLGISHVVWLTGFGKTFTATWQQTALRGIILTGAVAGLVWLTTRARLLWRT